MKKKLVVFGLGARGYIYASFAKKYPEKFDLVAIIDNAPQKAKFAAQEFPNVPFYACYQDFYRIGTKSRYVCFNGYSRRSDRSCPIKIQQQQNSKTHRRITKTPIRSESALILFSFFRFFISYKSNHN